MIGLGDNWERESSARLRQRLTEEWGNTTGPLNRYANAT